MRKALFISNIIANREIITLFCSVIKKIRHSKLLALTPFLVWCMVLLNGLTNRHHHVDKQGQVISHAHPIQQGAEEHEHTQEELIFWDLISNPQFQIGDPEIFIPENTAFVSYYIQEIYTQPFFKYSFLVTDFLRGPPVLA